MWVTSRQSITSLIGSPRPHRSNLRRRGLAIAACIARFIERIKMSKRPVGVLALALTAELALCFLPGPLHAQGNSAALGVFEAQSDVGSVTPPGTLAYDPSNRQYTIVSAGANLWMTADAFHFVWK